MAYGIAQLDNMRDLAVREQLPGVREIMADYGCTCSGPRTQLGAHHERCPYATTLRPISSGVDGTSPTTHHSYYASSRMDSGHSSGSTGSSPERGASPNSRRSSVVSSSSRVRLTQRSCQGGGQKSKTAKEQQSRRVLKQIIAALEDSMQMHFGFQVPPEHKHREQQAGNGNQAGLVATKETVMQTGNFLLNKLMEETHAEAFQRGVEAEWVAKMRGWTAEGLAQEGADPLAGTWMGQSGPICDGDKSKKTCRIHRFLPWTTCRKDRRRALYNQSVQRIKRSLGLN